MKKIFTFIAILFMGYASFAQVDSVTLVVSSDGSTKEEATNLALRSAIEQAFGTFVSANTQILNDELVKDEIATVASGNIRSYEEINAVHQDDGRWFVTLKATVSTKALTSYARSKGSKCEFAGATFGANIKMAKLNHLNSVKAFKNMGVQLLDIAHNMYDYSVVVNNPQHDGTVDVEIKLTPNKNMALYREILTSTINSLAVPAETRAELEKMGIKPVPSANYRGRDNGVHNIMKDAYRNGIVPIDTVRWDNVTWLNYLYFTPWDLTDEDSIGLYSQTISYNVEKNSFNEVKGLEKTYYFYSSFPINLLMMGYAFVLEGIVVKDNLGNEYPWKADIFEDLDFQHPIDATWGNKKFRFNNSSNLEVFYNSITKSNEIDDDRFFTICHSISRRSNYQVFPDDHNHLLYKFTLVPFGLGELMYYHVVNGFQQNRFYMNFFKKDVGFSIKYSMKIPLERLQRISSFSVSHELELLRN